MKKFFSQDKISVALVAGLGSIILTALLLTAGLLIVGERPDVHLTWYGAVFIPLILFVRHFIKQQQLLVTKSLFVILFVTFIAFMFILFSTHQITLNA